MQDEKEKNRVKRQMRKLVYIIGIWLILYFIAIIIGWRLDPNNCVKSCLQPQWHNWRLGFIVFSSCAFFLTFGGTIAYVASRRLWTKGWPGQICVVLLNLVLAAIVIVASIYVLLIGLFSLKEGQTRTENHKTYFEEKLFLFGEQYYIYQGRWFMSLIEVEQTPFYKPNRDPSGQSTDTDPSGKEEVMAGASALKEKHDGSLELEQKTRPEQCEGVSPNCFYSLYTRGYYPKAQVQRLVWQAKNEVTPVGQSYGWVIVDAAAGARWNVLVQRCSAEWCFLSEIPTTYDLTQARQSGQLIKFTVVDHDQKTSELVFNRQTQNWQK